MSLDRSRPSRRPEIPRFAWRRCTMFLLWLVVLTGSGWPGRVIADDAIRTPGSPPAVLERVAATDNLSAFAISADGNQAALASVIAGKNPSTELQLFSTRTPEPQVTTLQGQLRDLLFATDASVLYGILHRSTKRTGDTHLVLIDPTTLKVKRANRLPVGATDLDHWITARALLIASPAEIRSLLLPDLRSGPLFPVTGTNRSIASLGGGSLVLVGQNEGLELIDLEDRPGIEEMPVRERLATSTLVSGIAAAASGRSALARLDDGTLWTVEFDPLRTQPAGSGTAVAAPPVATVIRGFERSARASAAAPRPAPQPTKRPASGRERNDPPTPTATTAPPSSKESPAATRQSKPSDQPPPQSAAPATPATRDTPSETTRRAPPKTPPPKATPTTPQARTRSEPERTESPARAQEPAPPPPTPETTDNPEVTPEVKDDPQPAAQVGDDQLVGRVVGAAAGLVEFVVLRGPNNILREAARLTLDPDGTYRTNGLAPGHYRIQIDGGGGRVIASRPPFVMITIDDDATQVQAADLEALREL